MRSTYIVCYDVSDAKRLRQVFRSLHGYGDPLQYSVFRCILSEKEKYLMLHHLASLIHHTEDRVMVINIGPTEGRASDAIEFLGRDIPPDAPPTAVIV